MDTIGTSPTSGAQPANFHADVSRLADSLPPAACPDGYRQILLGYDGSPGARAALERAPAFASPEALVTVITVIPFESVGSSFDPIKPEQRDWQLRLLTDATAVLKQHGIEAFIEPAVGSPAPVILETARALHADLVILGRGHRHGRHTTIRRRSVRRLLLRHLECDVLVVSPKATPSQGRTYGSAQTE